MKKLFYLFIFGILPYIAIGQIDVESRLTAKVIDCEDIAINSSELFIEYVTSNQYDSAKIVLDFWHEKCGMSEPLLRGEIFLEIISSALTENQYDSTIFDFIEKSALRNEYSKKPNAKEIYEYNKYYFGYVPLNSNFDIFIKEFAAKFETFDNDLEQLFCLLLADKIDDFYIKIQESSYINYLVRKEYDKEILRLKRFADTHFDVAIGLFSPTKNLSNIIGNHPTLKLSYGFKFNKLTFGSAIEMRFGKAKSNYMILKPDTVITNFYFGIYLGIEASYDLFRYKKSELLLLGGFGYEGFDTELSNYNSDPNDYVSVNSLNLNGGLMYRWYFKDYLYIGATYRFNLINYNSDKVVNDLTGYYHTFSLSFGILKNQSKRDSLKRLRYLGRY